MLTSTAMDASDFIQMFNVAIRAHGAQQVGVAAALQIRIREVLVRISAGTPAILTETSHGLSQSFPGKCRKSSKLKPGQLLSKALQIHHSLYHLA
jgi:hypothetical protein